MKVSVVIPFFNRSHLLRISVASVLHQTLPAHEIILVDDCSAEDTRWLTAEFPAVRILRLTQNGGPARARYLGASEATGTHVATLDSDDFWYPDKLEKQVAFAEKTGDLHGIYSHLQWVQEQEVGGVRPVSMRHPGEPLSEYIFIRNGMLQANTLFMERQLYLETCRFSEHEYLEDSEMMIVADARNHVIYLQQESLGHWNCNTDPGRISLGRREQRQRDLLKRLDAYFTPKARAAFEGRNLAPCLVTRGEFLSAAQLIGHAVRVGAFSPWTGAKVFLNSFFPVSYRWVAGLYRWTPFGDRKIRRETAPYPSWVLPGKDVL